MLRSLFNLSLGFYSPANKRLRIPNGHPYMFPSARLIIDTLILLYIFVFKSLRSSDLDIIALNFTLHTRKLPHFIQNILVQIMYSFWNYPFRFVTPLSKLQLKCLALPTSVIVYSLHYSFIHLLIYFVSFNSAT